jgi:hypothetical protein
MLKHDSYSYLRQAPVNNLAELSADKHSFWVTEGGVSFQTMIGKLPGSLFSNKGYTYIGGLVRPPIIYGGLKIVGKGLLYRPAKEACGAL